jgi:hypothetical protein
MTPERNEALTDLIERVGGLTGADEQTDCLIHQVVYPDQRVMFDGGKAFGPGPKRPATYGRLADFPLENWDDWHGIAMLIGAQPYTKSTDAALALTEKLLPERSAYILREALNDLGKRFRWHIAFQQPGQMEQLPIAICLALLRAISASKGDTV